MPASTSRLSLVDCFDAFDRAIASTKGIRIRFPDEGAARSFQSRMMRARTVSREDNLDIYPAGHQLHGRSPYDRLQVRLRQWEDGWVILVEPLDAVIEIEEIE